MGLPGPPQINIWSFRILLRIIDGFLHTMLLNISTYLWIENKVWCCKAWSKGEIVKKIITHTYTQDHVKYKYVEQNLGLNHDEEFEVNASILGPAKFGEYALVHLNVPKIIFSLGLGLDSLDG